MPAWLVPFLPLVGVAVTFVLGMGRDIVNDRRDKQQREARVRRLLAHHATTLADDAKDFLAKSERCFGLPEPEIAGRFASATVSEHVYRDQIAQRVDDLSDELIELFRNLDAAAIGASHAVNMLKQWSGEFLRTGALPTAQTTLTEELEHATARFRELQVAALETLKWLAGERASLPAQSQRLLEAPASSPGEAKAQLPRGD